MAKTTSPGARVLKNTSVLSKLLAFFGISTLLGAIAAGMMLPAGMLAGAASQIGTDMIDELPAELHEEPISVPSVMLDKNGKEIATFYAEDRAPVDLENVSPHMIDAIIAIEDERFYEHSGVDGKGLTRAMVHNATSDTQQGASTLTQQYVNNVLVNYQNLNGLRTTVSGTKQIPDKLREMKLAVGIEKTMTKDEILEGYLNIVLFSGRTYGVEAAARLFFSKTAADLTIAESAMLAGLVQSPNALDPRTNPEGATSRRNLVLGNMYNQGFITKEEYDEAVASDIVLKPNPLPSGCYNALDGYQHFCDYVERHIEADPSFGPDKEARARALERNGLQITTTLDSEVQDIAVETTRRNVPPGQNEGVSSALVTVQQDTGNIISMAQNQPFDKQAINFNVDHEWGNGNGFQAGSTLKPFVALAWMGSGKSMRDTVDASKDQYAPYSYFPAYCLDGGRAQIGRDGWPVKNAIGNMKKPMRMDYGLFWSINTATVSAAYESDLCAVTDITTAAGLHGAATGEPLDPSHPSFVLGAQEVSPLALASAYSTLGSGGTYCEPRAIESIIDAEGKEYNVPPIQCDPGALNPENIKELNNTLTALADQRISQGRINFPIAGKTGTNNYSNSTWFVGYTSELTTASWMGRHTNLTDTLKGLTIGDRYYNDVWGALIAGPMWVDFMQVAGPKYGTDPFPKFDGPTGNPRADGLTRSSNSSNSSNNSNNNSSGSSSDTATAEPAQETAQQNTDSAQAESNFSTEAPANDNANSGSGNSDD